MFGEDIGFIYFSNLGYCSLREFIVYCTNSFRRVLTKAEGEIFKSPLCIYIYIADMHHCHAVLKVPSLTVTDE